MVLQELQEDPAANLHFQRLLWYKFTVALSLTSQIKLSRDRIINVRINYLTGASQSDRFTATRGALVARHTQDAVFNDNSSVHVSWPTGPVTFSPLDLLSCGLRSRCRCVDESMSRYNK